MRPKLVLVGNGMVGQRLLEELVNLAPIPSEIPYDITVLGAEPQPAYNRIALSPVLSGERVAADLALAEPGWYAEHGISLRCGTSVAMIDLVARQVCLTNGETLPYDRLVLATGSEPIRLPVPGTDLPGVLTFRDLTDVEKILGYIKPGAPAVVIGGGLLGLEAASGLRRRGMSVSVVHLMDTLMERQLDPTAGAMLQRTLKTQGLEFYLSAETAAILGTDSVSGVRLTNDTILPACLVVMAVGIRPSAALAESSGLAVGRGVLVNDRMQTSDPHVFAIGECAEHRGRCYGLVAPLYEQATACAQELAGRSAPYTGSVNATTLKVSGVSVYSAGAFTEDNAMEPIVYRDPAIGTYKKLVISKDRLLGAVLVGDTRDGAWYGDLIRERRDIGSVRDAMIFGKAFTERQTRITEGSGFRLNPAEEPRPLSDRP